MKKLILVDNFYSDEDLFNLQETSKSLDYKKTIFGEEPENFNLVINNSDKIFSKFLEGKYRVVQEDSGIFRKPIMNIHYESSKTDDDWIFITALKQTTFNLFQHNSGVENSFQETNLNFSDFTQWNYTTNILLEPNQGLFFRPWLFHSIQGGLIQYYRLTK